MDIANIQTGIGRVFFTGPVQNLQSGMKHIIWCLNIVYRVRYFPCSMSLFSHTRLHQVCGLMYNLPL